MGKSRKAKPHLKIIEYQEKRGLLRPLFIFPPAHPGFVFRVTLITAERLEEDACNHEYEMALFE